MYVLTVDTSAVITYLLCMDIEFDSAKDEANIAKHGVSLARGADVLANVLAAKLDARRVRGEERWLAFGLVDGRLFAAVYTMRGDTFRIISVRKASRKEQAEWLS